MAALLILSATKARQTSRLYIAHKKTFGLHLKAPQNLKGRQVWNEVCLLGRFLLLVLLFLDIPCVL